MGHEQCHEHAADVRQGQEISTRTSAHGTRAVSRTWPECSTRRRDSTRTLVHGTRAVSRIWPQCSMLRRDSTRTSAHGTRAVSSDTWPECSGLRRDSTRTLAHGTRAVSRTWRNMFKRAKSFNQDLTGWQVSQVEQNNCLKFCRRSKLCKRKNSGNLPSLPDKCV